MVEIELDINNAKQLYNNLHSLPILEIDYELEQNNKGFEHINRAINEGNSYAIVMVTDQFVSKFKSMGYKIHTEKTNSCPHFNPKVFESGMMPLYGEHLIKTPRRWYAIVHGWDESFTID